MFEHKIELTISQPTDSYSYKITVSDEELSLTYMEDGINCKQVFFGSIVEMEAVAKTMLKVVEIQRTK